MIRLLLLVAAAWAAAIVVLIAVTVALAHVANVRHRRIAERRRQARGGMLERVDFGNRPAGETRTKVGRTPW